MDAFKAAETLRAELIKIRQKIEGDGDTRDLNKLNLISNLMVYENTIFRLEQFLKAEIFEREPE